MSEPRQAIVNTLCFFDTFDHPLTKEELYRLLWCKNPVGQDRLLMPGLSFAQFAHELERVEDERAVECTYGFFHLPGRAAGAQRRRRRRLEVERKMNIAVHAIRLIRLVPFVRAVFVCNTVSFGWPKRSSDIDVFIVVQNGRIWTARAFATALLEFARLRRSGRHAQDKICLSFYASEDMLELERIGIGQGPDIYLAYWIVHLMPVYDPDRMLERIQERNAWVWRYIPQARMAGKLCKRWRVDSVDARVKTFMQYAASGSWFERLCKSVQTNKMRRNRESLQDFPDSRVVISDSMLKFHENDRRGQFREIWKRRCREYA